MVDEPPPLGIYALINVLVGFFILPAGFWVARGGYSMTGGGVVGLIALYFPSAYIVLGLLAGLRGSSRAFLALVAHNGFVTLFIGYWWYVDPAGPMLPVLLAIHLLALGLAIRAWRAAPKYINYSG